MKTEHGAGETPCILNGFWKTEFLILIVAPASVVSVTVTSIRFAVSVEDSAANTLTIPMLMIIATTNRNARLRLSHDCLVAIIFITSIHFLPYGKGDSFLVRNR